MKDSNREPGKLRAADFASDQEIRWCPGCGDFAILKQVQMLLPELGIPKENIVFISGIGCSSRFPYYMNTYGVHSIHGRAPAFSTGLRIVRPDLDVWMITGDGDALSIGGNHLIHLFRRNVNLTVLLFNNEIYGLTKGQYSPTSSTNTVTKSTPMGSVDHPFNPLSLALGADASFVARTIDRETRHQQAILKAAHEHKGSGFVEIYQNCLIFNDGVFDLFTDRNGRKLQTIFLEEGKPLCFGDEQEWAIKLDGLKPIKVLRAEFSDDELWIHEPSDLMKAQILARFSIDELHELPRPFGVFFERPRACYEDLVNDQIHLMEDPTTELDTLLAGNVHWTVD